MLNELKDLLNNSGLSTIFQMRREDDNSGLAKPFVAYRVRSNDYRIRAFELWNIQNTKVFRIYHSPDIIAALKSSINEAEGFKNSTNYYSDFNRADLLGLCKDLKAILDDNDIIELCKKSGIYSRSSRFEGLDLPDVDTSDENVVGREFTWKEIIKIIEDTSSDNKLKTMLSQKGIYLQRTKNGATRYIGSAYGEGGIISRWMKHLESNGDANHLNLFVLENGYNSILFTVIEICEEPEILKRERMWKEIFGTINNGPYDGLRLNNN
jgi:hypothetical protein